MDEQENKAQEVFETMAVPKAVMKNALPAMAAMLMVLIYNLADTFFIGQTHDALLVAAVSLATPVFLLFMAVGSAFGIGGTSVISRALGQKRPEYARKVCSFCLWGCVIAGVVMTAAFLLFMDQILALIGASDDTWAPTRTYLTIVSCGGVFVLISNCYSNVVRAEGESLKAMTGQLLGNLLNIVLDPILILAAGWGIAGAAAATLIGNLVGAGYYLLYFARGGSSLSVSPRLFTVREGVFTSVMAIGIPAALGSLLMSVSQIIINAQMSGYSDMAIAGMGVAMKVVTITGMVCMGLGQGVQPLLGYCVGAKLWERFRSVFKFSLVFAFVLGTVLALLCFVFAEQIVGAFLTDEAAFDFAVDFSRILLTTSWLFGVFYVLTNALQAMGAATESLVINLSRQGIVFIPALFVMEAVMGLYGLVWAQPVADAVSIALALALYTRTYRRMSAESRADAAKVAKEEAGANAEADAPAGSLEGAGAPGDAAKAPEA